MQELNLPKINCNIRKNEGNLEIFDVIRKKYIVLTPEEWVRQHLIHYLITELNYPRSLFRVESGLKYNKLAKRSDIVIYNSDAKPHLLVECKAPSVKIDQKSINQAAIYNTSLNAKYMVISNGMTHYCCVYNEQSEQFEFIKSIPAYK